MNEFIVHASFKIFVKDIFGVNKRSLRSLWSFSSQKFTSLFKNIPDEKALTCLFDFAFWKPWRHCRLNVLQAEPVYFLCHQTNSSPSAPSVTVGQRSPALP